MTLPPPSPKKIGKGMIIAIAVIVILVIAFGAVLVNGLNALSFVASPTPTPTATPTSNPTPSPTTNTVPYDFRMSSIDFIINQTRGIRITQGNNFSESVILTTVSGNIQSVTPQDVIWSADSDSSGIQCDFNSTSLYYSGMLHLFFPDAIPDGFSTLFTVTIPSSTPTDNYTITVTAKIGSVSHSISMLVSVESVIVTVSGTVNVGSLGITPIQIQFHDLRFPTDGYFATITGNTYSISIPNDAVYFVRVSKAEGLSYLWYNCDTFFQLKVPAGSTSITKDFTVLGS
jgi:hypothetical protein